jgi:tetratricopeptide (TPR) repeat protein
MRILLLLSGLLLLSFAPSAPAETLAPAVAEIRARLRAGDIDAAVEASDRAVKALSDNATAWWWAGRAYGQRAMRANVLSMAKWAGRSRNALEQAVALDPAHIDARFDLLSYYLMAPGIVGGGRDKALQQAATIAAQDAAMGKVAQARIAAADKQPERAESLFAEALALDPDNRLARLSLAALAGQRNDWEAARAVWQAQLDRDPAHALARYQFGRVAALSGEALQEGLARLDDFLAAGEVPEDLSTGAAHWRRGQILDRLGRRDEAIAALEQALAEPSVRSQAEADLARIRAG